MNNRQKELLRLLLFNEKTIMHIKKLSEQLGCSEKTVRNDLAQLDNLLRDYSNARLIRKPGTGIVMEVNDQTKTELLNNLLSNEPKTTEERLLEMTYELLISSKAFTLQHFADKYYMPKAVIKKDMEEIKNWFLRFNLDLQSKPRVGNIIQGPELQKRNALAHLSELIPSVSNDKNYVLDLFMPYEVSIVRKALQDMQTRISGVFTEQAMESLLIHALIIIKRTRQNSPIFVLMSEKEEAFKRSEYQVAVWFFGQLAKAFGLVVPEEELVYFTWHLISSKKVEGQSSEEIVNDEKTTRIVSKVIEKMGKLTLYNFESDSILKNGLALHMHSVINRVRFGFAITNPLLASIKKMYPYMFTMVILTLEEINKKYDISILEDEAAYLTLHFQASIERVKNQSHLRNKVLIVCHMGIGMSHLLEAKIEQQFPTIDVLGCIGKTEVADYLTEYQVDFIISTVELENLSVDHIVISPLFEQEDKKNLRRFVEQSSHRQLKDLEKKSLSHLISEELVIFDVEKEHRYEVVEMLASRLYAKGLVSKKYIHNAVNRERTSSTAIGGGIAIPHGDPALVLKSAIGVAILKNPIEWESEWVSLVFLLAISKEAQGEIRGTIAEISSLSESPLTVHELATATDFSSFVEMVKES